MSNLPHYLMYIELMEGTGGVPRIPEKKHQSDAGWDLFSSRVALIRPGKTINVATDIRVAMPDGWCALIKGRSSTMIRHGLMVLEGVVDAGYRGELFYTVHNPGKIIREVEVGDRLAQILFLPVPGISWVRSSNLPDAARGTDGFGSTGR